MRKVLTAAAALAVIVPLALVKSVPATAEDTGGVHVSPGADRPPAGGSGDTFTGTVNVQPLFDPNGDRDFSSAEVSFTPGGRTAWHTHPSGQTLVVTAGDGWVQEWGKPRQDIAVGDVVWIEPGVKHWHGARADAAMTHIAIQGFVDGTPVQWLEQVTDDQYLH